MLLIANTTEIGENKRQNQNLLGWIAEMSRVEQESDQGWWQRDFCEYLQSPSKCHSGSECLSSVFCISLGIGLTGMGWLTTGSYIGTNPRGTLAARSLSIPEEVAATLPADFPSSEHLPTSCMVSHTEENHAPHSVVPLDRRQWQW